MKLSTTALRALVLSANLLLIGLVAWTSYITFRYVDQARWKVEEPKLSRFVPPPLGEDPLRRDRAAYNTIVEVFEVEAPPEVVDVAPKPKVEPDRRNDASRLTVAMLAVADEEAEGVMKSFVMLSLPGGQVEKSFTEGMALDAHEEFKGFKGFIVKEIKREAVVLVDASGKETRLDIAGATGGTR